jgi:hypothetical protein
VIASEVDDESETVNVMAFDPALPSVTLALTIRSLGSGDY